MRLWRWLFPVVVLGVGLPVAISLIVLAANGGNTTLRRLFGHGELFMLSVTVQAGGYAVLYGRARAPRSHEVLRDVLVIAIALSSATGAVMSSSAATGHHPAAGLVTWGGAIMLFMSIALGVVCISLRDS